jgi:hypothetical protein
MKTINEIIVLLLTLFISTAPSLAQEKTKDKSGFPALDIPLLSHRISDNIIIVGTEQGYDNQLALKTDKGIVIFGSHWGPGIELEYNKIIEKEFKRKDFRFIINKGSRIFGIGGNVLYKDSHIIAQDEVYREMLLNQPRLNEIIQEEITVFTRKAERSRNILKENDLSKEEQILHTEWMNYCQRIANDLESGYEIILPSIIFKEQLILDLGNMTLHLVYFPNNGLIIWIPEEKFLSFTGMFDPQHIITSTLRPSRKKLEIDKWITILDEYSLKCSEVDQVVLGYKGFWPMKKIDDIYRIP